MFYFCGSIVADSRKYQFNLIVVHQHFILVFLVEYYFEEVVDQFKILASSQLLVFNVDIVFSFDVIGKSSSAYCNLLWRDSHRMGVFRIVDKLNQPLSFDIFVHRFPSLIDLSFHIEDRIVGGIHDL